MEHEEVLVIASQWRADNPDRVGGVVLIWNMEVYGWKNTLRDPWCERPGVIAVDDSGCLFLAKGGNDSGGAAIWARVAPG